MYTLFCSRCKEEKPLTEFKKSNKPRGYTVWCRKCDQDLAALYDAGEGLNKTSRERTNGINSFRLRERKRLGLCVQCAEALPPERVGLRFCIKHMAIHSKKTLERKARFNKEGRCYDCRKYADRLVGGSCYLCSIKRRCDSMGLNEQDYRTVLSKLLSDPICEVCGITANTRFKADWAIDHCHVTNRFRGISCHHCNLMLGGAKDNPETLRKGAEYLEKFKARANEERDAILEVSSVRGGRDDDTG